MKHWPGDPIDQNIDGREVYEEISSTRARSVIEFTESNDFSRSLLAGCDSEFALRFYLSSFTPTCIGN